jgi:hypothetical protein
MNVSKIRNLVAFVPARDYALSRRFYADLGFVETWGGGDACEFVRDGFSFILQNFHVKEHSANFMMSLNVEDADSWWQYIQDTGLKEKYGLGIVKPPTLQPWGLRVLYLTDPTGVLWHISDRPKA